MISVFLLVTLAQASVTPVTVQVRTVDQDALALPGIEITAIEVSECRSRTPTSSSVMKDMTGREGVVSFALPRAHAYLIRSAPESGFEGAETCVPSLAGTEPRYVQLQLRPDPSNALTLDEPSAGPPEPRAPLSAFAFVGAYRDARGRYYVVEASADARGIYVETPDRRTLAFQRQSGTSFRGSDGMVRFLVERGRIVAMEFTPAPARATRRQ